MRASGYKRTSATHAEAPPSGRPLPPAVRAHDRTVRKFGGLSSSLALSRIGLLTAIAVLTLQMVVNFDAGRISDLQHLYFAHRLYQHPFPYVDARIEYPVLTGVFMTLAAALTHGLKGYLALSSLGLWACAVGSICVLWSLSRRAAWWFALCPLMLVYSLLNWDLLAIFLMLLGWRSFSSGRYARAGAWLALGTFAKLYPAFLLAVCLVELARRWRSTPAVGRDLVRFATTATAVSLAVNVPFVLLAAHNWFYFWTFNATRNEHADLLSWLHLLDHVSVAETNLILASGVAGAAVIAAAATWRGVRIAHVTAVLFFAFMVLQKVNSPQYTLWLVAFALIADWEAWAIGILSIMGLTDYANAVVHIALVGQHSNFVGWYEHQIYPLDQGLRLLVTLTVGVLMTYRIARFRPARSDYADRRPDLTHVDLAIPQHATH